MVTEEDCITDNYMRRSRLTTAMTSATVCTRTLLFLWLSASHVGSIHSEQEHLHVLVLGGNGFIGAEVVLSLIGDGHAVTVLNRGTLYWDYESRVRPFVKQWTCDRTRLRECEQLHQLQWVDAVVDLTTYRQQDMLSLIDSLTGKTSLLVYISSDSVYEVCETSTHALSGGSWETDDVRPRDKSRRRQLAEADSYGHHKLAGEELLEEQRANGGFPFVALRLPDVMGARDNTRRWWPYLLWIRTHAELGVPLYVPEWLSQQQLSFVLTEDVAKAVSSLIKNNNSAVMDSAYNLAFSETCTLEELLSMIGAELGVSDVSASADGPVYSYLFPSVTRGPVNISLAERVLNWKPTPLKWAISRMVHFYEQAWQQGQFVAEREEAEIYLARRVFGGELGRQFQEIINQLRFENDKNQRTENVRRNEL